APPDAPRGGLLSGVLTAAFGGYLALAAGYPGLARLFPLVIGVPGAVLAGAQFALDLRRRASGGRPTDPLCPGGAAGALRSAAVWARQDLGVFGWAAGLVALTLALGFGAAIPLFLGLFLRLRGKETWRLTAVLAGAGWAFVYLVFTVGMKLFLFGGFLVRWLT
ncbi:MAG TPA: tripartite tricarboxylate transporter TctB family protein, partial [bacterium]|nr:tripartite tricarboxylate transporter TctB family protein [bacterium]